jgi:hypothetical protein
VEREAQEQGAASGTSIDGSLDNRRSTAVKERACVAKPSLSYSSL